MIELRRVSTLLGTVITFFALSSAALGKAPVVAGYERFYSGKNPQASGGQLLVSELNCLSCHKHKESKWFAPKSAPDLSRVGQRVQLTYLRKFIAHPSKIKPGTTMPDLFANTPTPKRMRQVEALAQFLASTGQLRETPPSAQAVQQGQTQFHQFGCVACHDPQGKNAKPIAGSVPLVHLEQKYSIPSLTSFLGNPLRVRPSGRMPHLNLNEGEATNIASFLLRDAKVPHKLKFKYFEGRWNRIPDFAKMEAKLAGGTSSFNPAIGPARDNFGVRFEGYIQIPRDGTYQFQLRSDDGSRLVIAGKVVVNNDGVHPPKTVGGSLKLQKGPHKFHVDFFEAGGGEVLQVQFAGPGISRRSLVAYVTSEKSKPQPKEKAKLQAKLIAEGKRLFSRLGCASCHQLNGQGKLASTTAKPWSKLNGQNGCLDNKSTKTPRFNLSTHQVASIQKAHQQQAGPLDTSRKANARIQHTMVKLNCYACHERNKLGGATKDRQKFFLSNQPEMGEEGRLPPTLTGVGAKLKLSWFKQLMDRGSQDRPYMLTRMPRFHLDNTAGLPDLISHVDRVELKKVITTKASNRQLRKVGRRLVGSQGLSCIKCHSFRNIRATGIQATSLTRMAARLDERWFHHYMKDPKRFRPTTRMPAPWPNGVTFFPKLLSGSVDNQVHAVWVYLKSGSRAAIPAGLKSNTLELVAEDEPVMYRNFIAGAGPRAIGVGYPERANLAFDANEMQIALIWHGAFIDAGRHWRGRGQGFQGPLGENVLSVGSGSGFAELTSQTSAWPTGKAKDRGYRFRGYLLNKNRQPTFLYIYKNVQISDFPQPVGDDEFPTFKRTFTLVAKGSPPRDLLYRAAVGKSIKRLKSGWFELDGRWKTRVTGNAFVRKVKGQSELIVSIPFKNNQATFTQEYQW